MHSGGLRDRVDVIILPDMRQQQLMEGYRDGIVPGQYSGGLGEEGIDNLREFVRRGGTLIAFNQTAATLVPLLSLPVKNALEGLKSDKFFCSGALLRVELGSADRPVTWGLPGEPIVMFEQGPAFTTQPGFHGAILARYPKDSSPLESGLLLHPEAIEDKVAALELPYGSGRIFLYGFKPQWRAQSHGTYKFFMNALYKYDQPPFPKPEAARAEGPKPEDRGVALPFASRAPSVENDLFTRTSMSQDQTPIRAPRGNVRTARGWIQEAAKRMLMNNLDPEVAEKPAELIVYGGRGKAARNWECFHKIVETLDRLENNQTLLIQSGKPVAVLETQRLAPRVLIANSNLVPHWATWEHFDKLDQAGLMMYGQMTAGSWIYIGTQGILQGTYETFQGAAQAPLQQHACRNHHRHRGPRRHGRRTAARRETRRRREHLC